MYHIWSWNLRSKWVGNSASLQARCTKLEAVQTDPSPRPQTLLKPSTST